MYMEKEESRKFKIVKNTIVAVTTTLCLLALANSTHAETSDFETKENEVHQEVTVLALSEPKEKAASSQVYPCDIEKLCAFELEMRMEYFASADAETAFDTISNPTINTETYTYSEYVTETAEEFGITEHEVEILTKVAWLEAGICSLEGQAAVVSVVLNRVESENANFPDSIYEVIVQEGQFNPAYAHWPFIEKPNTQTQKAVKLALSGIDYSNGACYYYNPDFSAEKSCKWFETLETSAEYDGHIFKYDVV